MANMKGYNEETGKYDRDIVPTDEDRAEAQTLADQGYTQTSRKYREVTRYDTTDARNWKPAEKRILSHEVFAAFREIDAEIPGGAVLYQLKQARTPMAHKVLGMLLDSTDEEALDIMLDVLCGHQDCAWSSYLQRRGIYPIQPGRAARS